MFKIYLQFLSGLIIYASMAYMSYHSGIKASKWFFPIGIIAAIIANFTWLSIAKADSDSSSLMIKGLIWDSIIMMCYLLVPIILFNAKFTMLQSVGIGLTLLGLFLTKL